MSDVDSNNELHKGIPLFVKILVVAALVLVLVFAVVRLGGCKRGAEVAEDDPTPEPTPVELPAELPPPMVTQWPEIVVEVESVARNDESTIIVHWRYKNQATAAATPFEWSPEQPNIVALTRLRDASGRDYSVAVSGTGIPLCSDVREQGRSMKIYGGQSLPAWALFKVPVEAVPPMELVLYGVTGPQVAGVKVPVLTPDEQAARAFIARETSWPDIWIQLDEVARIKPGSYRVKWRYVNRNLAKPFSWSKEQPDLPSRTQLFDFATGTYSRPGSASSIHKTTDGSPTTIPAGGEIPAEATFDGISGDHFELILHGALPVFYDVTN
jgi:hypothetical protein